MREDNKDLRSQLQLGLNQLAKILIDKNTSIYQSIKHISNTHSMAFENIHQNFSIVNDNIGNINKGNRKTKEDLVSICQGHSSLDAPSELNLPQKILSPLFIALLVPQAEG